MIKDITSTTRLNNGVEMPWLGLGVLRLKEGGEDVLNVTLKSAFQKEKVVVGKNIKL